MLVRMVALLVLAVLLIGPLLDEFTGGALRERLSDRRLAGRDLLMMRDLAVWEQNPLFGVGPGMSRLSRIGGYNVTLAHTEFTRMIAEHGLLGVLAMGTLLAMVLRHVLDAPRGKSRFTAVALCVWSLLFMVAVAFRLSAPAFCIGLSAALVPHEPSEAESDT